MECLDADKCTYKVYDTTFINNTASRNGAGMAFDYYQPQLNSNDATPTEDSNTFINNWAAYGAKIAAYPYQINRVSKLDATYVSG